MPSKPTRQIRSPKGRGSIENKILKEAVKKITEKRHDEVKKNSITPKPIKKK